MEDMMSTYIEAMKHIILKYPKCAYRPISDFFDYNNNGERDGFLIVNIGNVHISTGKHPAMMLSSVGEYEDLRGYVPTNEDIDANDWVLAEIGENRKVIPIEEK
jgi:hypothetical protein